jgi:hypothetical protein
MMVLLERFIGYNSARGTKSKCHADSEVLFFHEYYCKLINKKINVYFNYNLNLVNCSRLSLRNFFANIVLPVPASPTRRQASFFSTRSLRNCKKFKRRVFGQYYESVSKHSCTLSCISKSLLQLALNHAVPTHRIYHM